MTATQDAAAEALCHDPNHTPRWGMVIDVNRCVGCQTCTVACKHWNDTQPDVQWRRVLDVEMGSFPNVQRQFLVVGCQHCEEPPCVPVCPTGATRQREDGLVTMDYDVCIGCAYCAVSCPYQARTIAHEHHWYYGEETAQEDAVAHHDREGVAQKCTFCIDRVDSGLEKGLTPGVDPEATPACSAACIAQAITFGDYKDPNSKVSKLVADAPAFQMHEELGTNPQIKYLYSTPAVPGREVQAEDVEDDRLSDPANPLVGQVQKFWDWRAAMNWCFGGLSSGFAFLSWVAYLGGLIPGATLAWMNFAAAGLMSIGLFFVFLKIGRKMRFWRAISRPHTSWMTRELYVVALFFPAVLAGLVFVHPIAFAVAGLTALAFLWCQAKILHMARGIPAWRVSLMPWMIVVTGLAEGLGLLIMTGAVVPGVSAHHPVALAVGLLIVVANALLWQNYRSGAKAAGIPPLARKVIDELTPGLHAVGHVMPLVALILLFAFGGPLGSLIGLAGGVMMIIGGFYWKFAVITRASHQQGFAMPRIPQRGSGDRAAPPRTEGFDQLRKDPLGPVGIAAE